MDKQSIQIERQWFIDSR